MVKDGAFLEVMRHHLILMCVSLLLWSVFYGADGDRTRQVYINGFWMDRDELYEEEIKSPAHISKTRAMSEGADIPRYSSSYSKSIVSNELNQDPMHRETSFIPAILKHIADPHDIVYLSRFWFEKKISYAKDVNRDNYIDTISDSSYSSHRRNKLTNQAPMLSWERYERIHSYFMRANHRGNHPETFEQLGKSMKAIISNATRAGIDVKAIRYHTYLGHCYILNKVGSMDHLPAPVILTTRLDENTGYYSSDVWPKTCSRTGTYDHRNNMCREAYHMNNTLASCGKDYSDYKKLLDHPKLLLVLASQHHAFSHRKLYSLPLGARPGSAQIIYRVLQDVNKTLYRLDGTQIKKTRAVLINNSGWWYRARVNAYFKETFGEENSYSFKKGVLTTKTPTQRNTEYLIEITKSRFVICPPGIGYDTYRMWEVLSLGAIPVVESSPGLDKTYAMLPVLVVHDLLKITPDWLETTYACFLKHVDKWKFEILTQSYWDNAIVAALSTGIITFGNLHPDKNPYCWFYEESKLL